MSVDRRLLEILVCPVTKVPVKPLARDRLKALNEQIDDGEVRYLDGRRVDTPLEEGLVTDDGRTIYAVNAGIPVMLEDEAIGTEQLRE